MLDNPPTGYLELVGGSITRISRMIAATEWLYIIAITRVAVIDWYYFSSLIG